MCVIYKITSPTGRVYIGQTINFKKRLSQYKNIECKNQKFLYNSLIKHGFENHSIEILEETKTDKLNELEIYYILLYKSNFSKNPENRGLNLSDGGNDIRYINVGRKQSQSTIDKRIKALTGKKRTNEVKLKLSQLAKGRKVTNSTKLKISKNNKSSRKVINLITLKIYNNIREASETIGCSDTFLSKMLRGKYKNKTDLIFLEDYEKSKYL